MPPGAHPDFTDIVILLIIIITGLANLADILLKIGANSAGNSLEDPLVIFLTPWIWLGGLLGIGAMALWVYVLGRHRLSHAYPIFVGLGFVNITLISKFYLDEQIGVTRLIGAGLILVGIVVVHFQSKESVPATSEPAEAGEKTFPPSMNGNC